MCVYWHPGLGHLSEVTGRGSISHPDVRLSALTRKARFPITLATIYVTVVASCLFAVQMPARSSEVVALAIHGTQPAVKSSSKQSAAVLGHSSSPTMFKIDNQIGVLEGKLESGHATELHEGGRLLAHAGPRILPVPKTALRTVLPGSNALLNAPDWKTLEMISPSTGEVCSRDAASGEDVDGQPAFFVRPPLNHNLASVAKVGNLLSPCYGKIGPRYDPLKLPVREWLHPNLRARGVVVLVHGTTQHSGSFESFASYISNLGFKVVSLDMRGHGRWYHKPEEFLTGGRANYLKSSNDLIVLLTHLRVKYPTLPIYCIGESIGAAVSVRAGSANPDLMDGLILVSPGTRPCLFNPVMVVRDFIKGIKNLNRLLDVTRYITKYSSDDDRVTNEMVTDPLSRTELSGLEILQTGYFISTTPRFAQKLPQHLSVLIVQGTEDRIVRPSTIQKIFKRMPTHDKSLVVLKDCGHVLLGTSFLKPQVVDSISSWLVKQSDDRTHSVVGMHKTPPPVR